MPTLTPATGIGKVQPPGIEVVQEAGQDITRRRLMRSGKNEKQTRVRCKMCDKLFWVRTWLLLNSRPGSCKPCGLIRSKLWGYGVP